jgi:hypothetical protein
MICNCGGKIKHTLPTGKLSTEIVFVSSSYIKKSLFKKPTSSNIPRRYDMAGLQAPNTGHVEVQNVSTN